jgi:hypothetical protein
MKFKDVKKEVDEINKQIMELHNKKFVFTALGYHPSKEEAPFAVRHRNLHTRTMGRFYSLRDALECAHAIDRFVGFETSAALNSEDIFEKLKDFETSCIVCGKTLKGEYDWDEETGDFIIGPDYCSQKCAEMDQKPVRQPNEKETILQKVTSWGVDLRLDEMLDRMWIWFPDDLDEEKKAFVMEHREELESYLEPYK